MERIDKKRLHELFFDIKQGKKEAFNEIYSKYYKMVFGICFSMLKNRDNSDDVAQTVFTKLLKMPKENIPESNETTWLYTVTKNEVLQFYRKQKDDTNIDSIYDLYISDRELEQVVDMDEYYKLLKGLSEKEKEIISLKVLNDFTFKEIGQMLNMPTATVQWYYYKSIHSLKLALSSVASCILAVIFGLEVFKDKFKSGIKNSIDSGINKISEEDKEENIENGDSLDVIQPNEVGAEKNLEEKPTQTTQNISPSSNESNNIGNQHTETRKNDIKEEAINKGFLGISGVFLIVSIIFLIFFKKNQQKLRRKSSK